MQKGSKFWCWLLMQLLLLGHGEWFCLDVDGLGASEEVGEAVTASGSPQERDPSLHLFWGMVVTTQGPVATLCALVSHCL